MGPENNNKKWPGLKLFSPRAAKKPPVKKRVRNVEPQSPIGEPSSEETAVTESLTENEESPRSATPGRTKLFGRIRQQKGGDENEGNNSSRGKRRSSLARGLLRNIMFTPSKERSNTKIDGPKDAREMSESFQIDPSFDRDDFSSSRRSTALPPSISELSSSETSALSPTPTKRSPRPMGKGVRAASPLSKDNTEDRPPYYPSLSQKMRIGESKAKNPSPDNASRSPRPMKNGVGNSLVNFMKKRPSTIDEDSEASSFHPTLSQKIRIGQEEIKKRIETRQAPPLESSFAPPRSIDTEDCLSQLSSVSEVIPVHATNSATTSTHVSMATIKMSNLLGGEDESESIPPESMLQSPPQQKKHHHKISSPTPSTRSKTPTSPRHGNHRTHPRPPHSLEKSAGRSKTNSDPSKRSRGRSGARNSPKSAAKRGPLGSPTSPKKKSLQEDTHGTVKPPSISKLDSPQRKVSKSRNSPSHPRHSKHSTSTTRHHDNDEQHDEKRRARSHEPSSLLRASQGDKSHQVKGSPSVEDRKRSKSLDESLSRSKHVEQDLPKSRQDSHESLSHDHEKHHGDSKSSEHAAVERKRPKSYAKSPSKSPRRSEHKSPKDSAGELARSQEPSRSREGDNRDHSSRDKESPLPVQRKRSKSLDESLSNRKSSDVMDSKTTSISQAHDRDSQHVGRSPSRKMSHSKAGKSPSPRQAARKIHQESDGAPSSTPSSFQDSYRVDELVQSGTLPVGIPLEKGRVRRQRVLSKAELAKRDESLGDLGASAPSRVSRSPGRISSTHDRERLASSRSPAGTRRQIMREKLGSDIVNSGFLDSSRSSLTSHRRSSSPSRRSTHSSHHGRSSSPSRRSTHSSSHGRSASPGRRSTHSSSHHGAPRTPTVRSSVRSASPRVRTSPREKWETLLERKGSSEEKDEDALKPRFAAEGRKLEGRSVKNDGENKTQSPQTKKRHEKVLMPPLTPGSSPPKIDMDVRSPVVMTEKQKGYWAVNKMADKTFHSPLGDPPGRYSAAVRPTRVPSPLPLSDPPAVLAEQSAEDGSQRSRATTLKNRLRQLEQNNLSASTQSHRSSSAKSRTNRSSHSREQSSHTHRSSSSPSRQQRRQRNTDDSRVSPSKTRSYGRNGSTHRTVKESVGHLVASDVAPQKTKASELELVEFLKSP
jgi:hypothetical protein